MLLVVHTRAIALLGVLLAGCSLPAPPVTPTAAAAPVSPTRVVAIGDLHGDLASAEAAFRLAGAVDASGRWTGGRLVVVQVGDQTDRGDDELEILAWLERLSGQARAAGGAVHVLLGNHEAMNAQRDFRYVTPGGFSDFADAPCPMSDRACAETPEPERGRYAAFRPGGVWARTLADHPVALKLGDTLFVHAGLEPQFARAGLDALNRPVQAWLRDEGPEPALVSAKDGPLWSRRFGADVEPASCEALASALTAVGAARMVVGHTVQRDGITSACNGRVWRVDTGLSDHYGGPTEALEITTIGVRVLRMPEGGDAR